MRVAFADITPAPAVRAEIAAQLAEVVGTGHYLLGAQLDAFEAEFADFAGARHCVAVANGTDALRIALVANGVGPGDEVVVPALAFVGTWMAVSAVGATPVSVDVDATTQLIDPALVEAAVTPRTVAVIGADLYGHPADHAALRAVADRHGLLLLDDAAHAHGARLHDRPASSWADVATWSFHAATNIGALGDGGAVTTNDPVLARRLRRARNLGSECRHEHVEVGASSILDELQATVLRVKLRHHGEVHARLGRLAVHYRSALATSGLELPHVARGAEPSWHRFVVRTPDRDVLRAQLARQGIETVTLYPTPPYLQDAYASTASEAMPNAERAAAETVALPMGPHLDDRATAEVAAAIVRCRPLPAAA
jgi:dTDP-3-amino-3,4,6-trideoxy-alpha-D-glucose transaminase